MLVLSRKKGEEIIINGNIRVSVVALNSKEVRVGVQAPHEIPVHRKEIHEKLNGNKPKNGTEVGS